MTTMSEPRQRSGRAWLITVLALTALLLGIWSAYRFTAVAPPGQIPAPATKNATVIPTPRPLKPFTLTDHRGKPFSNAQLQDHWTFLFFGYTHCPDVCPTTLSILSQAARLLAGDEVKYPSRFVFVSVDPERDSLERLGDYVPYFSSEFMGAVGTQTALQELTSQLGVLHRKVEDGATALTYLMDHTASIMLTDPRGRLHAVFSAPHDAETIAYDFRAIRKHYER